ncbi:MAG: hypothetical protein COS85_05580 [Armatimonadetes bacterium CG07_land_8_20_14_0_80_59_28]|nr:MAG: hypothetical protein COS85_05580 [Armatimonadetes bacterium CG07_land_8_20_14_0_80_59_28]PIX45080.1 MAG: hypothetical protein COZ56_02765 [Armatimonadetes bacterium CG_4_8_14_3_um_filter_58_9]PIY43802.1 MAG: hypothetical protein COZ05_09955 [Armatimonadetes bacterium CG_4_10_14_3_um_filter_59_10]
MFVGCRRAVSTGVRPLKSAWGPKPSTATAERKRSANRRRHRLLPRRPRRTEHRVATTRTGIEHWMVMGALTAQNKTGVDLALELARDEISKANPELLCAHGAISFDPKSGIRLPFLGSARIITLPDARVYLEDGREEQARVAVLLLHYLLAASQFPTVLSGPRIDFRGLPGGMSYIGPFSGRTLFRLAREFGDDARLLREAAHSLKPKFLEELGDVSFTVEALPQVPVEIIFWANDDEFPARATFVYDASIGAGLRTEDVVVLSEALVGELIRAGRKLKESRANA